MSKIKELSDKYPSLGVCQLINLGAVSYSWLMLMISMIWNRFDIEKSFSTNLFIWICHIKIIASLFVTFIIFLFFAIVIFAVVFIFDQINGE